MKNKNYYYYVFLEAKRLIEGCVFHQIHFADLELINQSFNKHFDLQQGTGVFLVIGLSKSENEMW